MIARASTPIDERLQFRFQNTMFLISSTILVRLQFLVSLAVKILVKKKITEVQVPVFFVGSKS